MTEHPSIQFDETAPLLEIEDLVVEYETRDQGRLTAVNELSLIVEEDETFGLVGESGCGKSTIANAILGLLPSNGSVRSGEIRFRGVDITDLDNSAFNELRWERISMVSQGAMNALNPVHKISRQIVESIRAHRDVSKREARERVAELFELVGLDPARMDEYPHQFSGGMKQRAYIAMALALEPDLIIADEPTTALDVIVQDQILHRINELQDELGVSMILITHDISVVAETCQRMGVMYSGHLMEYGNLKSIFSDPHNPYTLGLQNAFPTLFGEQTELISIPGNPPDIGNRPKGCQFANRCPFASTECLDTHPPLMEVGDDHYSACYRHEAVKPNRSKLEHREPWEAVAERTARERITDSQVPVPGELTDE